MRHFFKKYADLHELDVTLDKNVVKLNFDPMKKDIAYDNRYNHNSL